MFKHCWVVKFLADTPPCPGGGDHGKPACWLTTP